MVDEAKLREDVLSHPGGDSLPLLVNKLGERVEARAEARELCFKGLTANPDNHRARLELARLFYLDGYNSFSLEQLVYLRKRIKVPALDRLIAAFGSQIKETEPGASNMLPESKADLPGTETRPISEEESSSSEILAELDLDEEILGLYEDVTKGAKS